MKTCIFCGSRAGSREHIFAKWILKTIRMGTLRGFIGRNKNLKIDGAWITRSVCKGCNEGWMSKLETASGPAMEPMILDKSCFLDTKSQLLVSRWALKTAMVIDSTTETRERPLFYTAEQRRAMREGGEIPSRSFVWLGRDLTPGFSAASTGLSGAYAKSYDPDRIAERSSGQVTTLLVGSLAIQVVTVSIPKEYSDGPIHLNPAKGPWDELLIPIWPPRDNRAYWPPVLAFTDHIPALRHNNILRERWSTGKRREFR